MPTTPIVSISDGSKLTVSDMVGNPLFIPTKIKELLTNVFITQTVFRNGGANTNGLVGYRAGDPIFLDGDPEDVAEFGEIPVAAGRKGSALFAVASKKGLGIRVSREMRDENNVGEVNRQVTALVNTFKRSDDRVFRNLLGSSAVPTLAASAAWDTANGNPRIDIARAIEKVTTAAPSVAEGGSAEEWFGFEPDTVVLNPAILPVLMDNEKFLKVYQGNIANENIQYTGKLPGKIFNLDPLGARSFPTDRIWIGQRGVTGFYSDTRPFEVTGLYPEGNGPNGGPTESFRCDATRKTAYALDQPKAGIWLTGLVTP
ncbi:Uncharacterised protein [Mycobacteroides abscessus subsp. abscessus]|uniref:Major capsid protein n=1 Tax=Mycobacteroides abscessus subsp. abscessus TaxID=1185650 RepID=A0AB38CZU8_9MYCO|nr:hypothetical protein [Mycobacteroides abscessus]MDO3010037.1 hypothetical protein [Mycobacteroides abscessus subsp. abscessus]NOS00157.1 hypothetical protein [Mycobacteroides abscessus]CPS16308.1 Uncharacterised protein [Mycobacteroides abscessus]CPS51231.1 Uncharacterised protein [Mycobacteroides abscessus]CPS87680.1 Uncharacterised protein [Mycobacteroides abscessus]